MEYTKCCTSLGLKLVSKCLIHESLYSSIAAALLVIASLYLLLWAKSREYSKDGLKHSSGSSTSEPLLVNTA